MTKPTSDDDVSLGRLGYAQELLRRMGGFSSFAVSFSIISVLTGCLTGYAGAISLGGPAALGIGWPLVSIGTLVVALAMAELTSAFPTAGATYHWSALLGGPGWGWITAVTNVTGQLAIVAAVDFGCAKLLAATLGFSERTAYVLLVLILLSHALVNALSVWLVAILNDLSATVHVIGVVVLVGLLFALGKAQPAGFLVQTRADDTMLGFVNGLALSMFTFTGYDASATLAEETHDPARRTAWGILSAVGVSAIAGYLLLCAMTLAIRDLPAIAADKDAALTVMKTALGDGWGRAAMALALAAMWFCGLSSVTSASRTLYAFARDRGLPGATYIGKVDPRTKTPLVAIVIMTVGPLLLCFGVAPFSDEVFDATSKMATMALYASYGTPIFLGAIARQKKKWKKMGPINVGSLGVPIAWVAVLWSVFVLVVCSLPPNQLAAKMLGVLLVVLAIVWLAFVRRSFEGPKVKLVALEGASADPLVKEGPAVG
jgi:amino acid transporter